MSALAFHIDRLSASAKKISFFTDPLIQSQSKTTPFTTAVLDTHLGDLIREVDRSEIGLFTISTGPQPVQHTSSAQLTRTEFTGASPLKTRRRHDGLSNADSASVELEPEVYAQAALKYIDRYDAFRAMPRYRSRVEGLLSQLAGLRENVQTLAATLQEHTQTRHEGTSANNEGARPSLAEEEHRIEKLQQQIHDLRKRKENMHTSRAEKFPRTRIDRLKSKRPETVFTPANNSSSHEKDLFWTTPVSSKTMRLSKGLIMDEEFDAGDISTSFSPVRLPHQSPNPTQTFMPSARSTTQKDVDETENLGNKDQSTEQEVENQASPDNTIEGFENTVMPETIDLPDSPAQQTSVLPTTPLTHVAMFDTPGHSKKVKIKVTYEVERIIAKMWTTMGDIIMPGHSYDASSDGQLNKPPKGRPTIAHLEELASSTPVASSPSKSSVSSDILTGPTAQQILTAHLILCLLSSPNFSVPLNKLKESLTSKAESGVGGQGATRVIYGCVAKRLLKIDRGGREQIARFDI